MRRDLNPVEQRWVLAEQSAGFGVWDLDVPGDKVHYSSQWKSFLGYEGCDGTDDTATWRARVHPQDLPPMLDALGAHLNGREPAYEMEFRLRAADGAYRWVLSRGRVVERDAQGQPLRAVGTLTDLTDHRQRLQKVAERERAAAAQSARGRFLNRMSHELRTPLNAVLGFSQLLSQDDAHLSREDQRRYAGQIERAGWQLLQMIDDVLDLSDIDSGQMHVRLEPVALAPLVTSAVDGMRALARQHGVTVHEPLVPPALVLANAARVQQVLRGLLSNAIKYNRPRGGVVVEGAQQGQLYTLAVIDTGVGIAPHQLPRLFEPFDRLGRANAGVEGAGIGLALARSLVDLMGGELTVDSTEGVGSVFKVSLPLAP